eukprot:TRINITY_DN1099_c0_g1_i1.p1 TRINITY_DN1099_c0_g1~~TRINITY_DN1099_c0_g1_i1.p1  ORF type:complete len:521 (-),score=85.57 TRINITY_DN1099_c0_g1_i1:109-1671(-)
MEGERPEAPEDAGYAFAGSSTGRSPSLWLHACHGGQDGNLTAAGMQNYRVAGRSIAEVFVAQSEASVSNLGVRCRIDGRALVVDVPDQDVVALVNPLLMAEVSWSHLTTEDGSEIGVVAIVPPANGAGIRGTSVGGNDLAGTTGWFLIFQSHSEATIFVELLSQLGCLRDDLHTSFFMDQENALLGEGAYASVYRMSARNGKSVAVKQMNCTPDFESIETEVQALVELQGEHIIGFQGIFWRRELEQIRFSAVFDLAPNGDLLYKVLKHGQMSEAEARPLFVCIMKGLLHVHNHQIVHRDIKTENVLLGAGDIPVIADFGLACHITNTQQMTRRCGSAGFVAPEVCLGKPYDCKVDNFGAGVILFFLLSKEMPFSSPHGDSAATMRKTVKCALHLHSPPFDAMTSRLRNIIRQLICKSLADRLTAAQTLENSWITGKSDKSGSSSKTKKSSKADDSAEASKDAEGDAAQEAQRPAKPRAPAPPTEKPRAPAPPSSSATPPYAGEVPPHGYPNLPPPTPPE